MASSFFSLCASSTISACHGIFFNISFTLTAQWYGAINTSNFLGLTIVFKPCYLSSYVPHNISTCNEGIHFCISLCQLLHTVKGQIIKCLPDISCYCLRYAKYEIVWIVLPKPISSAKIPFIFLYASSIIHIKAYFWYYFSFPPFRFYGCTVRKAFLNFYNEFVSETFLLTHAATWLKRSLSFFYWS